MKPFNACARAALAVCLGVAGSAYAQQNTRTSSPMFPEPASGGMSQIVLGAGDLILSYLIYPELFPEAGDLKAAEGAVVSAMDLPVSEPMRQASIAAINSQAVSGQMAESADTPKLSPSAQERVRGLEKASIVTESEKQAAIARASEDLAIARARAITAATRRGLLPKTIHTLRVLGSTVLLGDALGRVYVWYALDANPTWSPAVTLLRNHLDR